MCSVFQVGAAAGTTRRAGRGAAASPCVKGAAGGACARGRPPGARTVDLAGAAPDAPPEGEGAGTGVSTVDLSSRCLCVVRVVGIVDVSFSPKDFGCNAGRVLYGQYM